MTPPETRSRRGDRARALLVWPGGLFGGGANFGVPQLLAIAASMKAEADIDVDVVDLDAERGFGSGGRSLDAILEGEGDARGYDLVGISCYSSYDYLKVLAIAERVRAKLPRAWIATGGYHPSARPDDFTGPDSAVDFVIVGDGEACMARLAKALVSGKRPLVRVIGPEPIRDPGSMPRVDWTLLERYRPVARKVASQAEIYLSRGCPYDCAFCMERAKRDTSWRALEPGDAVEEMHRLDRFLDLSSWTLFVADALFGMKVSWRRQFLEELARRPLRARKVWLLVRLDLLEREDLALMARANVAPGFGLESGDPEQVKRIRKVGRLSDYLDQMLRVAGWARELDVPWGANVIVGHPGETEQSIRTSAKYFERLFLGDPRGTTGFLSVDPFRLYPGSPIDEERTAWEESTGMRVHRYPWWHDGDQDFLSEWVDPSYELDFRRAHALRHELFPPILEGIAKHFRYSGPAPDYFRRAIDEQIDLLAPRHAARTLALDHLWRTLSRAEGTSAPSGPAHVRDDAAFASFSRAARRSALTRWVEGAPDAVLDAAVDVPRERFVPLAALPEAHLDRALPLDDSGRSTISAMHAYIMQFRALELGPGDDLVDLGGGAGYGAALAAQLVGPSGRVTTVEIDAALSGRAGETLGGASNVKVVNGDAHDVALWGHARKVSVGFDVGRIPEAWVAALAPGGRLVAPEGGALVLVVKGEDGAVTRRSLGAVSYVRDRSALAAESAAGGSAQVWAGAQ
ncbi:MAG: cobalamin-dependent protein [Deltaproteobacteria bacterium]|nr:cobalamin-dependent protein [Deltaproteobacteria bacterium]